MHTNLKVQENKVLPTGFAMRAPQMDDIEATVALANAYAKSVIGAPEYDVHEFRADWDGPTMDRERDLRIVTAPDDEIVGYAGVWDMEPHVRPFGWIFVHPDYQTSVIGEVMLAWLEERAQACIAKAPEGTRVVLRQGAHAADTFRSELLEPQGYDVVRYWFKMRIEMDEKPPEAVFPADIAPITFAEQQDLPKIIRADIDAFRDHWGFVETPFEQELEEWQHWIETDPDHDPTLWFLAMDDDEIAGVCLCAPKMKEDPDCGYVYSLGVRRPWRRQGLALALLHHCFGEFYRRGKRKVALDVDASSLTGATRLYEKAGMHVHRRSVTFEKELRPGKDLTTQTLENT